MKYYLIAGEASGDLHASNLMREIARQDPDARFRCIGGDLMVQAGGQLLRHYRTLAYMGVISVVKHLPAILAGMRQCRRDILTYAPDAVILVDYPGFNLRMASYLHRHSDANICYYIAPKIWAWKEWRIKSIRRDVHHLLSILPFEVPYFRDRHHYAVHYVGNPSVDAVEQWRSQTPTDADATDAPTIAILPGSRRQEIRDNLPRMLDAAGAYPQYRCVVAGAPAVDPAFYRPFLHGHNAEVRFGCTYAILRQASAALVTSGTATLEAALIGTPQVVCYYLPCGRIYSWLRSILLKVPYISLVNLILGETCVKELVAHQMTVPSVQTELGRLLHDIPYRQRMLDAYARMRTILGEHGASRRAAEIITRTTKQHHGIQSALHPRGPTAADRLD